MSMMADRLLLARSLMTLDGSLYAHIDYTEKERLRLLLDEILSYRTEIIWRIGWVSGYKARAHKYIRNHDTIYYYSRSDQPLFNKHYIPYPEGYTRRDGEVPDAQGYPLEDTWNCSELDSLNSIQIMSFSKEKVGCQELTQKNENLLARMLRTSSNEGDVVVDFFGGSGTTAAAAQKMSRRWVCIEMASYFWDYALPRVKQVLFGDRYGISSECAWKGGGGFAYCCVEQYEDALENITIPATETAQAALELYGDDYLLKYMLDLETRGSASLLNVEMFKDPFDYKLKLQGENGRPETTVDLIETFNYLLGLDVRKLRQFEDNGRPYRAVLGDKKGKSVVVVWRSVKDIEGNKEALMRDRDFVEKTVLPALMGLGTQSELSDNSVMSLRPDRLFVNGASFVEGAEAIEPEFKRLMFAPLSY